MRYEEIISHDCDSADKITKKLKGCDDPVEEGNEFVYGKYVFDRCPFFYFKDPQSAHEIRLLHNWYSKGMLPFSGTILDQPTKFIRAMNLMDQLINHIQLNANKGK